MADDLNIIIEHTIQAIELWWQIYDTSAALWYLQARKILFSLQKTVMSDEQL